MTARVAIGMAVGMAFFALAMAPHFVTGDVCSPYAARLGLNPGLPSEESPHGMAACDDALSLVPIGDAVFGLFTVLMCIVGAILVVRVARIRAVWQVTCVGIGGALLSAMGDYFRAGLGIGDLITDRSLLFSLAVVGSVAAIVGAVEMRRLPNTSLERTRGR